VFTQVHTSLWPFGSADGPFKAHSPQQTDTGVGCLVCLLSHRLGHLLREVRARVAAQDSLPRQGVNLAHPRTHDIHGSGFVEQVSFNARVQNDPWVHVKADRFFDSHRAGIGPTMLPQKQVRTLTTLNRKARTPQGHRRLVGRQQRQVVQQA
jgi:hypothetical protein